MESQLCLLLGFIGSFALIHLVQAQDQQGFISLDCGLPPSGSPYNEPSTGLTYTSDANFVQSGKSGTVVEDLQLDYIKPYLTLRYFPNGTRNCYNLDVVQGTNYLIKAIFVYGNYDGQKSPPIFDLYLGPNKWDTADLRQNINGTTKEIIHISRLNSLQVCLVKTGTTTPLISALELRPLKNDTYLTQSGSLKLLFRRYLSKSDRDIRYPDDVHDRRWSSYFLPEWTQITTTLSVSTSNNYEPPQATIATAATPANASAPLTISWTMDPPTAKFYSYIHFAEIQTLQANATREFNIVINKNDTYGPYSPTKLEILTIFDSLPVKCDGGECNLRLVKTLQSTLPPLANALEVFMVIEFPQSETDQNDVLAIKNIQATYGLGRISWQGDPCLPEQYLWDGLKCSYMNIPPRIVSLHLSSSGLTGNIEPSIQNLTQLQELDLSNNNLTGGVPDFLVNMKSLLVINLSGNNLNGSVPQAILEREKAGLRLNVQGNPKLFCPSDSCKNQGGSGGNNKKRFMVPVVASVASLGIVVAVLVLFFVLKNKRPSSTEDSGPSATMPAMDVRSTRPPEPSIGTKERRFTYSEVLVMTNSFQRVLGKGGFGVVYHGYVNDTEQVAVKMLSQSSAQGYKQFKAEVELLLRVHHKNLVSLVGYCDEGDKLALIYEYMANGDLKEHLSGKRGGSVLSWASRLKIAAEAAQGLEYLHNGSKPPVVHRDIKSTNILLNEHFQAKLADFGISRSFPIEGETHVSTVVVGTPGYLDPEYYQTNWLSEKSDVYSFGIVLLEIISNQPVIDKGREKPHIAERVGLMLSRGDLQTIMDPSIHGDYDSSSVWKAVELAMSCVNPSSARRPNMSQVIIELNECLASENSKTGDSHGMDSKSFLELSMTSGTEVNPSAR